MEYNSEAKSLNESTNLPNDYVNKKVSFIFHAWNNLSYGLIELNDSSNKKKELKCFLRTKIGFRKQQGFQPELVCLLYWSQRPPVVTNINIYPKTNM
jgi:hypothetical protein